MSSSNRRILVVDDDPASCELVAYWLKSLGYDVAIAPDGRRALNMNFEDEIELVILDFHMPGYDGTDVLAVLRGMRPAAPIKVLVLTADESEEARQVMDRSGADGFLTKPVDLHTLRTEVARLMPGMAQAEGALHRMVRARKMEVGLSARQIDPRKELRR